ncbi:DUF3850 domain-containing protein [Salmonella enterica]|nr:DUF3850 domain-containing protein [Salmonella enterica]
MTNNKLTGVEHNLKIAPEYFAAVVAGVKHAEMRFNDRNYQTGDVLNLCEWDDGTFTGDFVSVDVTRVCELPSVPGYALLSFELQERYKADSEPAAWKAIHHSEEMDDEVIFSTRQALDAFLARAGWWPALTEIKPPYATPQPALQPSVGFVDATGTDCECVCPACKHEFSIQFEY